MKVIRDSEDYLRSKKVFQTEKQRILDMSFDTVGQKSLNRINQFISERQSERRDSQTQIPGQYVLPSDGQVQPF